MAKLTCRYYFTMPSGYICDIRDCSVKHRPITPSHTEHVVTYCLDNGEVIHEVLNEDNYRQFIAFSVSVLGKSFRPQQ